MKKSYKFFVALQLFFIGILFCHVSKGQGILDKFDKKLDKIEAKMKEAERLEREAERLKRSVDSKKKREESSTRYAKNGETEKERLKRLREERSVRWKENEATKYRNINKNRKGTKYVDEDYFFMDYTDESKANTKGTYISNRDAIMRGDYYNDEYIENCLRNEIRGHEDTDEFLKKLVAFYASNKRGNDERYLCKMKDVGYRIVARDEENLPSIVNATYYYTDKDGNRMDRKYELGLRFAKGIPSLVWFPSDTLWSQEKDFVGVLGRLNFCRSQDSIVYLANKKINNENKEHRIKNINPKFNDSITKALLKKYPGADCSKCLVSTVKSENKKDEYEVTDGHGHKSYKNEYYTLSHYKQENICSKNLLVVGIGQGFAYGKTTYEIITRRIAAKEVIKFTTSTSDNVAGRMIGNILFGGDELKYIDLSRINKPYDVENGGEIQYLRVVEDKK